MPRYYLVTKKLNASRRLIYSIRRGQHIRYTFRLVCWLDMKQRRKFHAVYLCHTILSQKTPPYLYLRLRFKTDIHSINIRRRDQLTVLQHRYTFLGKSYRITYAMCTIPCLVLLNKNMLLRSNQLINNLS